MSKGVTTSHKSLSGPLDELATTKAITKPELVSAVVNGDGACSKCGVDLGDRRYCDAEGSYRCSRCYDRARRHCLRVLQLGKRAQPETDGATEPNRLRRQRQPQPAEQEDLKKARDAARAPGVPGTRGGEATRGQITAVGAARSDDVHSHLDGGSAAATTPPLELRMDGEDEAAAEGAPKAGSSGAGHAAMQRSPEENPHPAHQPSGEVCATAAARIKLRTWMAAPAGVAAPSSMEAPEGGPTRMTRTTSARAGAGGDRSPTLMRSTKALLGSQQQRHTAQLGTTGATEGGGEPNEAEEHTASQGGGEDPKVSNDEEQELAAGELATAEAAVQGTPRCVTCNTPYSCRPGQPSGFFRQDTGAYTCNSCCCSNLRKLSFYGPVGTRSLEEAGGRKCVECGANRELKWRLHPTLLGSYLCTSCRGRCIDGIVREKKTVAANTNASNTKAIHQESPVARSSGGGGKRSPQPLAAQRLAAQKVPATQMGLGPKDGDGGVRATDTRQQETVAAHNASAGPHERPLDDSGAPERKRVRRVAFASGSGGKAATAPPLVRQLQGNGVGPAPSGSQAKKSAQSHKQLLRQLQPQQRLQPQPQPQLKPQPQPNGGQRQQQDQPSGSNGRRIQAAMYGNSNVRDGNAAANHRVPDLVGEGDGGGGEGGQGDAAAAGGARGAPMGAVLQSAMHNVGSRLAREVEARLMQSLPGLLREMADSLERSQPAAATRGH